MSEKEFTPKYIFLEEIQTRVLEINNYLKILNAVLTQEDEMYYLQDFAEFVRQKQQKLSDFIEEGLAKPVFPVLKQK